MTYQVLIVAFVTLLVLNLSTAAPPPKSEYIGCCKDFVGSQRDLFLKMTFTVASNQQCQTLCGNYGYGYAGTQNGNECWCGYNNCTQGVLNDKLCNKPCSDSTQMCGGPYRNTVYKVPTRYMGCVEDTTYARFLPYSAYKGNNKNTPVDCIATCKANGHTFAGVQYDDCWCGSQLTPFEYVDQEECNSPCSGNSQMSCGGYLRNAIWRV